MLPQYLRILVLVLLFAAVAIAAERMFSATFGRRAATRAINQRLDMIQRGMPRDEALRILRRRGNDLPESLPLFVRAMALWLERLLVGAGMLLPSGRLALILLAAPVLLFLLMVVIAAAVGLALGAGRLLLLLSLAAMFGAGLPLMVLQVKADRRRRKVEQQFPVALDVFVRALRAGHPTAAALDLLTVEMSDPLGSEFGLVIDEVTYGADLKDALSAMAERWQSDDMRMFVVSLSVQTETGGNLAEILENLSRVIRERASMMMKVRALSSEGRMTAVMLTALPVLAFGGLFMLSPGFYLDVADDPAFFPGFGGLIVLYFIGFFTIRKMVDLKV